MKRVLLCICLLVAVVPGASAVEWLTDVPTALARAKAEHKVVLLDFTGSDWCGWCIKLKQEVFDNAAFAGFASANLIMVEVDFPKRKQLSGSQKTTNDALASKYGIEGFPTVIVLNANGDQIGKTGYIAGGPPAFIANLKTFSGMPNNSGAGAQKTGAASTSKSGKGETDKNSSVVGEIPMKSANYGDLTLKGISGAPNRRMVLINNETLSLGETAMVKSNDKTVEVTVKEIRDNSVIIVADGKSQELKYGSRK